MANIMEIMNNNPGLEDFLKGRYITSNPQLLSDIAIYTIKNEPIYASAKLTETKIGLQIIDVHRLAHHKKAENIFKLIHDSEKFVSHDFSDYCAMLFEKPFNISNLQFPIMTVEGLYSYGFYQNRDMHFHNKEFFDNYIKKWGRFDCINLNLLSGQQLNDLGREEEYTILLSPISAYTHQKVLDLKLYPKSYSERNAPLISV